MIKPLIPFIALFIACCLLLTTTAVVQTSKTKDSTDFYYQALVRNTRQLDSLRHLAIKMDQKINDLNNKIRTAQSGAKNSGQDTVLLNKTLSRDQHRFDIILVQLDSLTGVSNYLQSRLDKPKSSRQ